MVIELDNGTPSKDETSRQVRKSRFDLRKSQTHIHQRDYFINYDGIQVQTSCRRTKILEALPPVRTNLCRKKERFHNDFAYTPSRQDIGLFSVLKKNRRCAKFGHLLLRKLGENSPIRQKIYLFRSKSTATYPARAGAFPMMWTKK